MKIKVDWYKLSGKWYSGDLVEIGETQLWQPEFKQAIVDNQKELVESWNQSRDDGFFVVTSTTDEQDNDPNFHGFYNALFTPDKFFGIVKTPTRSTQEVCL